MIHALQSRGQCQLAGGHLTKDHPLAAEFVDAVNTFYGRGDIPIGVAHSGITNDEGKFLKLARVQDDGVLRYPHDLDGTRTPAATDVLRKVLSQQPDQSVAIAQVGFSTNLAQLLASPPDDVCPLERSGAGAAEGASAVDHGRATFRPDDAKSASVGVQRRQRHPGVPAASAGLADTDCVERFRDRHCGAVSGREHRAGLRLCAASSAGRGVLSVRTAASQPAHVGSDECVVRGLSGPRAISTVSPAGHVTVEADGYTRWDARDDGPHKYLQVNDLQVARVTEALVQLSSQPPVLC